MRAHRHDPVAIPLGHIEQPSTSRERSALTAADRQRIPTITRRTTADFARDLATSAGHLEWRDVPDEIRAEMRAALVEHYERRLIDARLKVRIAPGVLSHAERVVRLETCLAAARRLP